ncbi:MAG: Chemotaxis response regulator protein-glutamate methylesterase [Verrucomicrobiae bacterium]|nr:Chemotaxis response regulator protein-glutamate methylesterase [Verrucomicrobiae bacterium]
MADTINIVIADNELSEREKLKSMLANEADFQIVGEARDGREAADLVRRERPRILLIKEDLPVQNGLAVAEQLTTEMPEVGIILILTGSEGEEVWHKMLRAGIREFMTRPIAADRLIEEVRKVARLQEKQNRRTGATPSVITPAEGPKHQIITVTGPRGGCGKTVIATNLAVALAGGSDKVAIVDLNLWGGDIAMLLDMTPRRSLGDLLPGFGGIDYDVVDSVMGKHGCGVSVLAAPLTGTFDGSTLSRYMVQGILEALREHYEFTLVDTGYANLESTLAAMDYSDVILVVVGMDLPRLRDGKLYLKNLLAANYPKEKIRVVVNRAGGSREIPAGEVESILEFPVLAQLPNDEGLVASSVNLGQPFVTNSPNRPLSRALQNLAEGLAPSAAAAAGKKRSGGRWFSFMQ